jgi:hypothetical protein
MMMLHTCCSFHLFITFEIRDSIIMITVIIRPSFFGLAVQELLRLAPASSARLEHIRLGQVSRCNAPMVSRAIHVGHCLELDVKCSNLKFTRQVAAVTGMAAQKLTH